MVTQDKSNLSKRPTQAKTDGSGILDNSCFSETAETVEQSEDLLTARRMMKLIQPAEWTGKSSFEEAQITVQADWSTLQLTFFKTRPGSIPFEATLNGKLLPPEDSRDAFQEACRLWTDYAEPVRRTALLQVGKLIMNVLENPSILDWEKNGDKFEATANGMKVILRPDRGSEAVLEVSFQVPRHYPVYGIGRGWEHSVHHHGKATTAYNYLKAVSNFAKTS